MPLGWTKPRKKDAFLVVHGEPQSLYAAQDSAGERHMLLHSRVLCNRLACHPGEGRFVQTGTCARWCCASIRTDWPARAVSHTAAALPNTQRHLSGRAVWQGNGVCNRGTALNTQVSLQTWA